MIHLASRLNYITNKQKDDLLEKSDEVFKIIRGLIESFNSRKAKGASGKVFNIFPVLLAYYFLTA